MSTKKQEATAVIAPEVAQQEFERFVEAMDLDLDTSTMDDEDKAGLEKHTRVITLAVKRGYLVINDNGEPVFKPVDNKGLALDMDAITFHEPSGSSFMTMDKKKKNHDVAKMHAIMGDMTKLPPSVFANLKMRNYKVCQAVVSLFLG